MPSLDLATLRDLRDRVGAAKEGDRDLDAKIALKLGILTRRDRLEGDPEGPLWAYIDLRRNIEGTDVVMVQEYSASTDAAFALIKQALPNWKVGTASPDPTRSGPHVRAWAKVEPYLGNDEGWKIGAHEGLSATVPLAILSALLEALIAQTEAASHGE